jgi:peptide/nickel transport system substrate-binding protein
MNHTLAPADDINVRQGIAASVDRAELVDRAFGGNAEELYSQIPPGFIGATEIFDDLYGSPDLDLAREKFGDAGYTEDNKLQLTIDYPPNRYGGVVADAMQILEEQLERTGVVEVTTQATDWATYLGECIGGEAYSVCFLGWFFDYPDSSNYIEPWTLFGGLGSNVTDGDNVPLPGLEELISLITQAATTTDTAQRAALYEQVQELYADDVVTIPLWFEPERVFYWDYISGNSSAGSADSLNIGATTELQYLNLLSNK